MKNKLTILMVIGLLSINVAKGQWQQTTCPIGSSDGILSLAANGNYVFAGVDGLGVEVSSNNGTSWNASNNGLTSNYITSFSIMGSEIFTGTDVGVFKSADDAAHWSGVNTGLSMLFISSLSNNGSSVFAGAGFGQIFRTDNNGSLWIEVSNGLPSSSSSAMVTSFVYKDGFVFTGMTGEGVYKTNNNGANWTVSNNGMTEPIVQSLIVSGDNILTANNDGLYSSADDGSNWNPVSFGSLYIDPYSLAKTGSSLYLGTNKGVFLSTDNGATWDSINTGLTNRNVQILAVGGTYLYAMIPQSGIWRRPLSEIIGVNEIQGPVNLNLFPNPVITTLNISSPSSVTTAEIYDPTGQLILTKPVRNNQVDIGLLPVGMYFIKLNTTEGSVVRKLVKE